ncbi:MAG: FAD-dependent oxidoreductase, partial [Streptosporangiaceae bacterium]
MPESYVIVGAGLAGAKAAQTLREEGFGGDIVLVGEEQHRPYERPPLTKGLLLGKEADESVFVHAEAWYAANDVTLITHTPALSIDRTRRSVRLADGQDVPYAKLLLATGAAPRKLKVPGAALSGVHT